MPNIGDPFGPKYTLGDAYQNSPRLRAVVKIDHQYTHPYMRKNNEFDSVFQTDWHLTVPPVPTNSNFSGDHLVQRRIKNEEDLKQAALLDPPFQYTLMPKLEEMSEQMNGVSNKQDDLSKTLDDMSIKAGNADDRLDLVEQKTMAMGKKLDTIQRDVNEIKTMVAEIHAALNGRSSSSRS